MVTAACQARLRATVSPPGEVSVRLETTEFVDTVRRGWPDLAVLDPTLAHGKGVITSSLVRARTPTVLYAYLTPLHARATVEVLRVLPAQVLVFGCTDDAASFAAAVDASGRATRSALFHAQLAPTLEAMPLSVRAQLEAAVRAPRAIQSVRELACHCGVHRATLARMFVSAGFVSVRRYLFALELVRHFPALTDPSVPALVVARRVGVASSAALNRRCTAAVGENVGALRAGISLEAFCTALARRLVPKRLPGDGEDGAAATER